MQIILGIMFEKLYSDRLRNNRSLGNGKSDNKKKKNDLDENLFNAHLMTVTLTVSNT